MGSPFSSPKAQAGLSYTNASSEELHERRHTIRGHKQTEGNHHNTSKGVEETVHEQSGTKNMVGIPEERYTTLKKYERENSNLRESNEEWRKAFEEQGEELAYHQRLNKKFDAWSRKILEQHVSPYAKNIGLEVKEWTLETMHAVIKRLFQDATKARVLNDQVQVLQKELLVKVNKVQAAPDGQVALDFRAIASLVKTLSRTTHVTVSVDDVAALGNSTMLQNVSAHHWADRAKKKCLIEAWIWSILDKNIFHSPFAIFGELCNELRRVWQQLFLGDEFGSWPRPTALSEAWRCTTQERMMGLVDREVIASGEPKGKNEQLEPSILQVRKKVKDEIQAGFAALSASPNLAQVQSIIDRSFTLAMKMSIQRYRLQVTYPAVGAVFNKEEMVAILQADDGDIVEGTVAFVVNPGLTKWGDTHGEHFDQRYDIVPALVQLDPLTAEQDMANFSEDLIQEETSEASATCSMMV
ncbi:hypothetical protein DE146DRAFT_736696 [Phaeosphaeria sp. MPI-PUGE-AT-0046c]|nr:hypothetical protein DE146DRAFT_736696 [Phaeosphaeria sp. MPI-PUGE-AT-0046c]